MSAVRFVTPLLLGTLVACGGDGATGSRGEAAVPAEERVSRIGEYRGFSEAVYDGWTRRSSYISSRDGTRLAADFFHPTSAGVLHEEPLPVVWTHMRYLRARRDETGATIHMLSHPLLFDMERLLAHGYVLVMVDVRGSGASFGHNRSIFPPEEAKDAYDVTEWLAAQPWSTGQIGMFLRSYLGSTQLFAASEQPPSLRAIFPAVAPMDLYHLAYTGGIYQEFMMHSWSDGVRAQDVRDAEGRVSHLSVDDDADGALHEAAMEEHLANWDPHETLVAAPFRNSLDRTGKEHYSERSPIYRAEDINESGIAIYHRTGWFDGYSHHTFTLYRNLTGPQKLISGPWFHNDWQPLDLGTEHLRWFDYWLKGINNGIMDEPPIHYWMVSAPEGEAWRSAWEWPLPTERPTDFYLVGGRSGTIESVNDGILTTRGPDEAGGRDEYRVDFGATQGLNNRWNGSTTGYGRVCSIAECGDDGGYPDLAATLDAKALTYTSEALTMPLEIVGHPVAHLWVSSSEEDGDFFVFVEEVTPDGRSVYVTEGALRASHRKVSDPPYDFLGLPWHRSYEADVEPLPGGPVELLIALEPTAKHFARGSRVRVTISGADADNRTPLQFGAHPVVTVYRDGRYPSRVTLPVVPIE